MALKECPNCGARVVPVDGPDMTRRRPFVCTGCGHLVYRKWAGLYELGSGMVLHGGAQLSVLAAVLAIAFLDFGIWAAVVAFGLVVLVTVVCSFLVASRWPLRADAPVGRGCGGGGA